MVINPKDDEHDYATFGKIILLWGYIESSLALILECLYQPHNKLKDPGGVPLEFSTRINHAKHGYGIIAALAPIRHEAEELLDELTELHDKRSVFAHGYYEGINESGFHIFTTYESRPGHNKGWLSYGINSTELKSLAETISSYRDKMAKLSIRTRQLVPKIS